MNKTDLTFVCLGHSIIHLVGALCWGLFLWCFASIFSILTGNFLFVGLFTGYGQIGLLMFIDIYIVFVLSNVSVVWWYEAGLEELKGNPKSKIPTSSYIDFIFRILKLSFIFFIPALASWRIILLLIDSIFGGDLFRDFEYNGIEAIGWFFLILLIYIEIFFLILFYQLTSLKEFDKIIAAPGT